MAERINNCLSSDLIKRYVISDCSIVEQRNVEEHIELCNKCEQKIRSAQQNPSAFSNLDSPDAYDNDKSGNNNNEI